jgi:hypothetical protein
MSKYNELVVDKTLLKKLSTVKTTINNNNDFFVKQLNSKTSIILINITEKPIKKLKFLFKTKISITLFLCFNFP